jgi:hypothetical protein
MTLALVGVDGREPALQAWTIGLRQAGVPFELIALQDRGQRSAFLGAVGSGAFQGLIVADGEIVDRVLGTAERELLDAAQRRLRLRRLVAHASPTAARGLRPSGAAGPLDGKIATLTDSGRGLFPYLRGELAMDDGSWAQPAVPGARGRFEPLLVEAGGRALLGIHRSRDGREEMVQTFAANAGQSHAQLLRPGQIRWLTRGTHLGCERVYLPVHVDDVLLANHAWSVAWHATDDSPQAARRMTAADGRRAGEWARARGLRLDLVCNGRPSDRGAAVPGAPDDALLDSLRAQGATFAWINHTYGHVNLDQADRAVIDAQIGLNLAWARRAGIDLEPGALVTGAHSGLGDLSTAPPRPANSHLVAALERHGVRFVACDASRSHPTGEDGREAPAGSSFRIGGALAVPRYPLTLPYDAVTAEEALDELRRTGAVAAASWSEVVAHEATRVLTRMLGNDPRPHFCHQSNLIGAGVVAGEAGEGTLLTGLMDAVMERYRTALAPNTPILQPSLSDSGRILQRDAAWRAAVADGSLCAFADGAQVRIENRADVDVSVPLTGTTAGATYAGTRSGWLTVAPGTTLVPGGDVTRPR